MRFLGSSCEENDDHFLLSASFESNSGEVTDFRLEMPLLPNVKPIRTSETSFLLGLALAFSKGEEYHFDEEVCSVLLRNVTSLVDVWKLWGLGLKTFKFHARTGADSSNEVPGTATAMFYTGGVDSSFTMLRRRCDMALSVHFEDGSPLSRPVSITGTAGVQHVPVGSNLLLADKNFTYAWGYLTHGVALAAVAHLFAGAISRVLISSSHTYSQLIPWGSHPLTDPLLSSGRLAVEHFGTTYTRFEKIQELSKAPESLQQLIVCGQRSEKKRGRKNCSECGKCIRTMAALEICGAPRSSTTSFEWSDFSPEAVGSVKLYHANEVLFFRELYPAAVEAQEVELASNINKALKRSYRYVALSKTELFLRKRFPWVNKNKKLLKPVKDAIVGLVSR